MRDALASGIDPLVLEAVQLSQLGPREDARRLLGRVWRGLDPGDSFHRCVVAHYLADLQAQPRLELFWDEVALQAALTASADDFEGRVAHLDRDSFLPSLWLNLAASYERVGDLTRARRCVATARDVSSGLPPTALGELTREAIGRLERSLTMGHPAGFADEPH